MVTPLPRGHRQLALYGCVGIHHTWPRPHPVLQSDQLLHLGSVAFCFGPVYQAGLGLLLDEAISRRHLQSTTLLQYTYNTKHHTPPTVLNNPSKSRLPSIKLSGFFLDGLRSTGNSLADPTSRLPFTRCHRGWSRLPDSNADSDSTGLRMMAGSGVASYLGVRWKLPIGR